MIENLRAEQRRRFEELGKTQDQLRALSHTVVAPRRVVSVTVGHGGAVKDIKFPNGAYKNLAPAELASVVLKTIKDAQDQVALEAADIIAPTLPPGMDARKLFTGEADLQAVLPAVLERRDEKSHSTNPEG
jgi:DNA-binding protein YbaB